MSRPRSEANNTGHERLDARDSLRDIDLPSTESDLTSTAILTPTESSDLETHHGSSLVPWSCILHVLNGIATVTGEGADLVERISAILRQSTVQQVTSALGAYSVQVWSQVLSTITASEPLVHHRCMLAIALALLLQSSREDVAVSANDLDFVWSLIHSALTHTTATFKVSRSSQGFLAIPLSSLISNGRIDQMFRLHVWEANDQRGNPDVAIHAHQTFVQSWILEGQGTDHTYEAAAGDSDTATHAEYGVSWSGASSEPSRSHYSTQLVSSTITNLGKHLRVVETSSETHTRNMSYIVPSGVLHSSEVHKDTFHATLVFFDGHRAFHHEAPVLGPVHGTSITSSRLSATTTVGDVARSVHCMRRWAHLTDQAQHHTMRAEWEESIRAYEIALSISESDPAFPQNEHYKHTVMARVGHMYRMLGRNEEASKLLESIRPGIPMSKLRAEIVGELAVVYRHMDRLYDSKAACEDEYNTALHIKSDRAVCRAIGTLGMLNYQLALSEDPSLIDVAIDQLTERVAIARTLRTEAIERVGNLSDRAEQVEWAAQREAIGLGRLSMCYQHKGDMEQATSLALEALNVQSTHSDSTKIAFSRGLYGRALLAAGRKREALQQFNVPNVCTPIISLSKEPSDEHRAYIIEMIDAGADLELRDEQGYSALDCTVYSGDHKTQAIIEEGLHKAFLREAEEKLQRHRYESTLRKGYRDIFQNILRPILLRTDGASAPAQLRRSYSQALEEKFAATGMFDRLKFVQYDEFRNHGRIPISTDGVTSRFEFDDKAPGAFIVFLSYRWLANDLGPSVSLVSPDDRAGTQYNRMLRALNQLLQLHPNIDPSKLGIWIDFACIDQASYDLTLPGVAALLMNLIQCNAMISLLDSQYYQRAWCCAEALMMRTLKNAYGWHMWYEHTVDGVSGEECLRVGPSEEERVIDPSRAQVTFEIDRPKLTFLERQTRLIG